MDKPTFSFAKTLLLVAASVLALSQSADCYAQLGDGSVIDAELPGRSSRGGSFFNRNLGTAFRFGYQSEGYGTQEGIVTLGSMKVFNMEGSTLTLDGQATLSDEFGGGYNAGVFYRSLADIGFGEDSTRINGIGFWSDGQSTSADNFFSQLGVTLESLGDSYDLRLQGNFPLDRIKDSDPTLVAGAEPVFRENFLMSEVLSFQRDTALTVIDFEGAKRVMDLEAWAFLGGYHLTGSGNDATGYRAGVRGYAVPDLAVSLQVTDDDIYHTNVMFGITWFVGRTNASNGPCGTLLDRFREPVQRNNYIATVQETIFDAITPYTDVADNEEFFFVHVDSDAPDGGDGTFENPFNDPDDVNGGSAEDDIVLVHAGSVLDGQFIAQDGQRFLGEGLDPNGILIEHQINTVERGLVTLPETEPDAFTLDAPVITGLPSGGDPNDPNSVVAVFELADNNEVNNFTINGNGGTSDVAVNANGVTSPQLANLDINGPFFNGVMFTDVAGNALIENSVTIDGTTDRGIWVNGGGGIVGANATVTNTSGRSVVVENRDGGSVTFGEINDTGEGILARNNSAGSITFSSRAEVDVDGTDQAVTLSNNSGASITFQELQATSTDGTTFAVNGGGTISVNNSQGDDGSDIINTGAGDALTVLGNDVDPNANMGNPNVTILGDIANGGGGRAVDIQEMGNGSVIVSGDISDPNQDGMGIRIQNNTGGTFSFAGETDLDTGTDRAVELVDNEGASITFGNLMATSSSGDETFLVQGGGNVTVNDDPNDPGFINNTGAGNALTVLGDNFDPNGSPGDPNVVIDAEINNTGGGLAVDIQDMTGGLVDINGDVNDIDPNDNSEGILVENNSGGIFRFDGQTTLNTGVEDAINLTNNDGATITFSGLNATASDGDTFAVRGGGTINVNDPNGLIENTGTGTAFLARGDDNGGSDGDPSVIITADIANSGGNHVVDIQDFTGGSVVITGDVMDPNGDGEGVLIANNTGGNFSLAGETTLDTGNNTAVEIANNEGAAIAFNTINATAANANTFDVQGGGTVTVSDPNGTIENTGTGTALFVQGNANGDPSVSVNADVVNSVGGFAVDIQDMDGGGVTVNGNVTGDDGLAGGIQIQDSTDGTFAFTGDVLLDSGANRAVFIDNSNGTTTTFSRLNATAAAGNTFEVQNGGTIAVTDPNSTLANTGAGTALLVDGTGVGDPNVLINADITNSGGGMSVVIQDLAGEGVAINGTVDDTDGGVLVQNNTSGAVIQFNDSVAVDTDSNNGVELSNNTGAFISFNGLDIETNSGDIGFTATGGGTLTVLNTNATSITQDGTGSALELRDMTISAAGAAFDTVNVTAGTDDAVILENLGGTGLVTVGSATDPNVAGQITTAGTAISVDNVNSLSVNNIIIANGTGDGVEVTNQSGGSTANFAGLDIDTTSGTGINVNGNDPNSTIAFSSTTVDATTSGDAVVNTNNSNATITYAELAASAVDGNTFTVEGGGEISVNSGVGGGTIDNTGTGTALLVRGDDPNTGFDFVGDPNLVVNADITNTGGGHAVSIRKLGGGDVNILGDVSDIDPNAIGMGILIEDNSDGLVTFRGDVTLNTGANAALTIQDNATANTVNFNAASQLDIDTTTGDGIVINDTGTVTILGTGNTVDTGDSVGIDIDNARIATINNTTINNDPNGSNSAINLAHSMAASSTIRFNSTTIGSSGATALNVVANGSGVFDTEMDNADIDVGDVKGILLTTGAAADRVNFSLTNSEINVGDENAFQAILDNTNTADVRFLLLDNDPLANNSATAATVDLQVLSGLTLNATVGNGPNDPNTNVVVPVGDRNRFVNASSEAAFSAVIADGGAGGTLNLDLRDNTAQSGGADDFVLTNTSGTFDLVDRDDTINENNNTGSVNDTGVIGDINPPLLQP